MKEVKKYMSKVKGLGKISIILVLTLLLGLITIPALASNANPKTFSVIKSKIIKKLPESKQLQLNVVSGQPEEPIIDVGIYEGLGDTVMSALPQDEIYGDNVPDFDFLTLVFNESLINKNNEATNAIQEAVDKAFGPNKAKVETSEDEDGFTSRFFVVYALKDIDLNSANNIILPKGSVTGDLSKKTNSKDLAIFRVPPKRSLPADEEPLLFSACYSGLWDDVMNANPDPDQDIFNQIGVEFNEPILNDKGQGLEAIKNAVKEAFGSGAVVEVAQDEGEENSSIYYINAEKDINLNDVKSIVLKAGTIEGAQSHVKNKDDIYLYVAPQTPTDPPTKPPTNPPDTTQPQPDPGQQPATTGPAYPGSYIMYGSRGGNVKTVQDKLNALGFNCGAVDGIFGPKTKAAVVSFQRANGLAADGIIGPLTWSKLFGNSTSASPVSSSAGYPGLVMYGMHNANVSAVQSKLATLGFNPGSIDGIFGPKTLAALKNFQRAEGLVIDGIVGPITWKALFG